MTKRLTIAEAAVDKELCERHFRYFVECAWKTIEPQDFIGGWHLDAVCNHLQEISDGARGNLIINIPPRHTKSLVTSVFWPAWEWGPNHHPEIRWLFSSYAAGLSIRDSVRCRRVIQSSWYQRLWGQRFELMGDQNAKQRYDTSAGGYRLATSVDGTTTGEGGDRIVIDDPNNVRTVESDTSRQAVNDWFDQVVSTRRNSNERGSEVLIQQRSHADDLTGHIIATSRSDYEMLVLPAEFDGEQRSTTGFEDPRKEIGELLCPARFPREEVERLKVRMGSYAYAAQEQQRPSPREGGIFKREWWRYYPAVPQDFDVVFQSWDLSFKDLKSSNYVAGHVWGIKGANRLLLDRIHERLSFTATLKAVASLSERWPQATAKYIEDAANGPAVVDTLRNYIAGLILVPPQGSKESRAFAVSPEVEAGNVWLPSPQRCPWVDAFVEEAATFPRGSYDDDVDAMSQALLQARKLVARLDIPEIVSVTRVSPFAALGG